MSKRLRIAFATHSALGGGAELALLDLIQLLVNDGHVVLILSPVHGPLIQRFEDAGAQVTVTPMRWWAGSHPRTIHERVATAAALVARIRRVRRIVAGFRPDVAVTNTIATPALALAARTLRIPHMWLLHEYALPEQGLFLDLSRSATYRAVGALATTLLAASHALATEVTTLSGRACHVLYASVPSVPGSTPRTARRGPPYQLLSLGHVTPAKRQDELVRALALARGAGLDCRLVLVGRRDRDFENDLRRLTRDLKLHDHVAFEDETANPGQWFATSHALVSASRFEACPRVIVEALKASLPVVACNSAGSAELLAEGRGWLYESGEEHALANAVASAVRQEDREAAAEWAHHHFSDTAYLSTFLGFAHTALG